MEPKTKGKRKSKVQVIWAPQAKQILALERSEFEILYGGARGGGKTDAGMAWMAFSYDEKHQSVYLHPRYRGLVIRQQSKDLTDWVERAKWMYRTTGAEFVGNPVQIKFPSGAIIRTGHLNDIDAYQQYQGHEYQRELVEELTQIPSEVSYAKLLSSCRSTIPDLAPQFFGTTNPGDVGHDWVKKRWNIPDIITEPVIISKTEFGDRAFIHATVYDNTILNETDPNYRKQLEALPDENLRRAWLMGEWGNPIIPGAIYKEYIEAARKEGRIGKFPYNPRYQVHTYWDLGVSKGNATVIWFMQFIRGSWYVIDYYSAINRGLEHFREILSNKGYYYGQHYAPHDGGHRHMGKEDISESVSKMAEDLGIPFVVQNRRGVQEGILAVKLKFPTLNFDEEHCSEGIYALQNYRNEYDDEKRIYKDLPVHDWTSNPADALRTWGIAPEPVIAGSDYNWNLYGTSYT